MVGMRPKGANPDAAVAQIAARQHGVATSTQLMAAGLSAPAIRRRRASGRIHRIHRGVYAVGHPALSNEGRWLAAVLACGPGAVLSHRSAAELWGLLAPSRGDIHVTIPSGSGRKRRRGIQLHRSPSLPSAARTFRNGIPVTVTARTLHDLRPSVPPELSRRALRQAEFLGLPTGELATDGTRSELERDFLRLCRRYRLPLPEVNVRVGRFTVDFLWREQRLVVEIDGYAAHRGRRAMEDDRERELELRRRGLEIRRFTSHLIRGRAAQVATDLRRRLV